MTLGHSWSLHNELDESLKLHPMYNWRLHCPVNEKKGSTVTTCLVILSSRVYSGNNCLGRRIPRRTVMGTTDRRGCVIQKHIEFWKIGYWEQLSKLRDNMAERTVVGTTDRHTFSTEINSLNFAMNLQNGPSQPWRTVTGCVTQAGSDFY